MVRNTIKMLEDQVYKLECKTIYQEAHIRVLEDQLKFYSNKESLITTTIIAVEKITDVMAHVIGDMKQLREQPRR